MKNKMLSFVIPLLNEKDNLIPLYKELEATFLTLSYFTEHEFIFVNDGSTDHSLTILEDLAAQDKRVKVVSFTRNFGHEQATFAGLCHTSGEAVVLIDADLQDPPDLIKEFERYYQEGYLIIYGQRTTRLNETFIKKITSKAFYPVFALLTGIDLPNDVGDFCLLSRRAVNYIIQLPEKALFMRGLIYWPGLAKKGVPFVRRGRMSGKTKYNYSKLMIFALENIISFSTIPIYIILFLSWMLILGCLIGTLTAFAMRIFGYVVMTGWTSLIICMLFLFACSFFFLGLLGLYIATIFKEVKQRPRFLIESTINLEKNSNNP